MMVLRLVRIGVARQGKGVLEERIPLGLGETGSSGRVLGLVQLCHINDSSTRLGFRVRKHC